MIIYLSRLVRCQAWEGGYNPYSDCFKYEQGDEMEAVAAAGGAGEEGGEGARSTGFGDALLKVIPGIIPQRANGERRRASALQNEDEEKGDCNVSSVCCPWYASLTSPSLSISLFSFDFALEP